MTVEDLERTFIAVKPDGVQRGLIGDIITRFEKRGLKLVALKYLIPSKELLQKHYSEHVGKPFYNNLVGFMHSGPVCAMVWEGDGSVKAGRKILGATNPIDSEPGTVRGDYAVCIDRNICHGSDSKESAKKEIGLWFKPEEIAEYSSALTKWVYPE